MTQEDLKVTDKRMFTADGELREEFRHLEDAKPASETPGDEPRRESAAEDQAPPEADGESRILTADSPARPQEPRPPASPEAPPAGGRGAAPPGGESPAPSAPSAGPAQPPASGELSILDLVGLLAEHTALYLGEASLPDGKSVRDLGAAKLHLDLLEVLKSKTSGNLTADEQAVLEDILYRLRMIYVEKKRQE